MRLADIKLHAHAKGKARARAEGKVAVEMVAYAPSSGTPVSGHINPSGLLLGPEDEVLDAFCSVCKGQLVRGGLPIPNRKPKGRGHLRAVPTREVLFFLVTPGEEDPSGPCLVRLRVRAGLDGDQIGPALRAALEEVKRTPEVLEQWAQQIGFDTNPESLEVAGRGIWCDVLRIPNEILRKYGIFDATFPDTETEIYVRPRDGRLGEA